MGETETAEMLARFKEHGLLAMRRRIAQLLQLQGDLVTAAAWYNAAGDAAGTNECIKALLAAGHYRTAAEIAERNGVIIASSDLDSCVAASAAGDEARFAIENEAAIDAQRGSSRRLGRFLSYCEAGNFARVSIMLELFGVTFLELSHFDRIAPELFRQFEPSVDQRRSPRCIGVPVRWALDLGGARYVAALQVRFLETAAGTGDIAPLRWAAAICTCCEILPPPELFTRASNPVLQDERCWDPMIAESLVPVLERLGNADGLQRCVDCLAGIFHAHADKPHRLFEVAALCARHRLRVPHAVERTLHQWVDSTDLSYTLAAKLALQLGCMSVLLRCGKLLLDYGLGSERQDRLDRNKIKLALRCLSAAEDPAGLEEAAARLLRAGRPHEAGTLLNQLLA